MKLPSHIGSHTASAPSSSEEMSGPAAAASMAQPEDGAGDPASPRLVIRGESYETNTTDNGPGLGCAALTDWLNHFPASAA